jgi:hypothetical protein
MRSKVILLATLMFGGCAYEPACTGQKSETAVSGAFLHSSGYPIAAEIRDRLWTEKLLQFSKESPRYASIHKALTDVAEAVQSCASRFKTFEKSAGTFCVATQGRHGGYNADMVRGRLLDIKAYSRLPQYREYVVFLENTVSPAFRMYEHAARTTDFQNLEKEIEEAFAKALALAVPTFADVRMTDKNLGTKAVTCIGRYKGQILDWGEVSAMISYKVEVTADGKPFVSIGDVRR